MPWFRLEDSFANHPKVMAAGNAATGLWVRCGTYSARYLLDGHVSRLTASELGSRREVAALLEVGLWGSCADDDGYLMPDYLEFNPSRSQVLAQRSADAERKRRQREAGAGAVDHDDDGRFVTRRGS